MCTTEYGGACIYAYAYVRMNVMCVCVYSFVYDELSGSISLCMVC